MKKLHSMIGGVFKKKKFGIVDFLKLALILPKYIFIEHGYARFLAIF